LRLLEQQRRDVDGSRRAAAAAALSYYWLIITVNARFLNLPLPNIFFSYKSASGWHFLIYSIEYELKNRQAEEVGFEVVSKMMRRGDDYSSQL
jgi:hypothetical protein